jgi:hypothetical protein
MNNVKDTIPLETDNLCSKLYIQYINSILYHQRLQVANILPALGT